MEIENCFPDPFRTLELAHRRCTKRKTGASSKVKVNVSAAALRFMRLD